MKKAYFVLLVVVFLVLSSAIWLYALFFSQGSTDAIVALQEDLLERGDRAQQNLPYGLLVTHVFLAVDEGSGSGIELLVRPIPGSLPVNLSTLSLLVDAGDELFIATFSATEPNACSFDTLPHTRFCVVMLVGEHDGYLSVGETAWVYINTQASLVQGDSLAVTFDYQDGQERVVSTLIPVLSSDRVQIYP